MSRIAPLAAMMLFAALLLASPALAGTPAPNRAPGLAPGLAPEDAPPGLAIRIHKTSDEAGAPVVELTVRMPAAPGGVTELRITPDWGGVSTGGEDLKDLRAFSPSGEPLEVQTLEKARWSVEHGDVTDLELRYRFPANDHQASSDPSVYRRPVVNEDVFHTVGEFFIVTPEHLDADEPAAHEIEWTGFGESAGLACSFGAGPGPHRFESTLNELRHSIFLGGDVVVMEREVLGSPLTIAVQEHPWAFELDFFADMAASIVDTERAFFEDYGTPYYLISMIPVGAAVPGSLSFGGTGLHNSFSLGVQPGFDLEPGGFGYERMTHLLAHELLHEWNGRVLQRVQPEELCYWFSEGFTDFFTRRMLIRGGMIAPEDYVRALNGSLKEYWSSPARDLPNERVREEFWTDNFVQQLPYRRGDVVAIILDHALRSHSGGEESLDDLMRELVERGRAGWKVSNEEFFEIVAERTTPDVAAELQDLVLQGGAPTLDPETFAPCLKMRMVEVPRYDIGLDMEASVQAKTAKGVREGGPAHAAGLRDGDVLRGWSYQRGDTTQPVSFQVEAEGGVREVSYRPVSGTTLAPQFELVEAALDACDIL